MTTDILNTWQEIADYLKVSVDYARKLAQNNPDFPIRREAGPGQNRRVFSSRQALNNWAAGLPPAR